MAPSIINDNMVQGETFLPGQIFVFGGFALRANSLGHLEQVDSHAPDHQVRSGSLNCFADTRGDLIFDGFETPAAAAHHHDEHDLNLSSDHTQEIAPKQIIPSEATKSAAFESHTDSTSYNVCVNGTPDSSPAIRSGPGTPADTELDRLSIFEFSATDIFQHSPLGDVLNSLKNLSLVGDPSRTMYGSN